MLVALDANITGEYIFGAFKMIFIAAQKDTVQRRTKTVSNPRRKRRSSR